MIRKAYITVAEAAQLVGKSRALVYRHVRSGRLRSEETSAGLQLRTADVLAFFADRKPGRPRKDVVLRPLQVVRHPPVVYYVRFAERVKIGTTSALGQRIGQIPNDEIMAIEPGGADVERQRHQQFAHFRVRGQIEWFGLFPELQEHIAATRRLHGDPREFLIGHRDTPTEPPA